MNKKLVFLAVLVSLLALSLAFVSCKDDEVFTNIDPGTIQIRITEIPPDVMTARQNGQLLIGLFAPNNHLENGISDAIAGRNTLINSGDDRIGPDWYEFYFYDLTNNQKYKADMSAEFTIGIINTSNNSGKIIREALETNTTNVISYSTFNDAR
jgi:hypothetical protein